VERVPNPFGEVSALPVASPLGIALFGLLVWRLYARRRLTLARAAVAAALSIYAAGIVGNTIFPIYLSSPGSHEPWTPHVALIPFFDYEVVDALTNIAVFAPLGLLIPLLLARPTWAKVVSIAAAASLAIELSQLAVQGPLGGGHIADINDFIFNTIGGALGYGAFVLFARIPRMRTIINRFRWA
jgi:glycopeptide antibiotics resistance protein